MTCSLRLVHVTTDRDLSPNRVQCRECTGGYEVVIYKIVKLCNEAN